MKPLTTVELAAVLRIDPGTVYRLKKRGLLPSQQIGGRMHFRPSKLIPALHHFYVGPPREKPSSLPTDWMKPVDVADYLGRSLGTVLRWARKGELPYYRLGAHCVRFRLGELEEAIG